MDRKANVRRELRFVGKTFQSREGIRQNCFVNVFSIVGQNLFFSIFFFFFSLGKKRTKKGNGTERKEEEESNWKRVR